MVTESRHFRPDLAFPMELAKRRTAWLGREDSNLRMVESKSTALPLGDAPIDLSGKRRTSRARIPSGNAGL